MSIFISGHADESRLTALLALVIRATVIGTSIRSIRAEDAGRSALGHAEAQVIADGLRAEGLVAPRS